MLRYTLTFAILYSLLFPLTSGAAQPTDIQIETTTHKTIDNSYGDTAPWTPFFFTAAYRGNAVKKDLLNKPLSGEAIFTSEIDRPGNVAFSCFRGKLSANIGFEPTDFKTLFTDMTRSRRQRAKKIMLYIDGEALRSTQWSYILDMNIYMPQKTLIAKKLYNAAILGKEVTAGPTYKKQTPLILPKPTAVFADFGAECGVGRKVMK